MEQNKEHKNRPTDPKGVGADEAVLCDVLILEYEFQYCCEVCNEFYCIDILCPECNKWFSVYATDGKDEQGKTIIWDVESASKPPEGIIIECENCRSIYKAHDNKDVTEEGMKWIKIKMST